MFLRLMQNEFIKLFRKTKTWIVIALFVVFIGGLNFVLYKSAEYDKIHSSAEYRIKMEQEYLAHTEEYLKERETEFKTAKSEEEKNAIKSSIESLKFDVKNSKELIKNLEKEKNNPPKTWQEEVLKEKKDLIENRKQIEQEEDSIYKKDNLKRIDREIKMKDYYLDNNIEPIDIFGFSIGENFLNISGILGIGILAAGLAVFMSDIVSGECSPPTFKFLLVQPVSRSKVIFAKYLTIVISSLALIIGIQLLITVVGVGIIDGFDSLKSMVFVNERFEFAKHGSESVFMAVEGSGEYITYGAFLLKGLLFQGLYVVAITTFVFMLSALFKSSMLSMAVSVVFAMVGSAIMAIPYISNFAHLIFLSYGDAGSIITGNISNMYYLTKVVPETGIIVMLISIVVCYGIAHLRFVKRDLLV